MDADGDVVMGGCGPDISPEMALTIEMDVDPTPSEDVEMVNLT